MTSTRRGSTPSIRKPELGICTECPDFFLFSTQKNPVEYVKRSISVMRDLHNVALLEGIVFGVRDGVPVAQRRVT